LGGRGDRFSHLVAELIATNVDVLITHGTPGTRVAKQATTTITIPHCCLGGRRRTLTTTAAETTTGAQKSRCAQLGCRVSAQAADQNKMARGTVKWFNPTKGYGFIQPQGGGRDVFVHISAVERAGLSTLNEGQHIEYEIEENRGKTSAVNLKVT
jgi:cold shock protein